MTLAQTANGGEAERTFLGHPRGLAYIVFTEAWERFSFYGMQALLVLYMAGYLLQPGVIDEVVAFSGLRAAMEAVFGELSTQALATQLFGLYIGLVYLTPVFGGLIGDRWLGRKRAVIIGAVLMAIGHFLMAFNKTFLFALLALILGSGLLKGNLAAQVGALYRKDDSRRDVAFTFYNISINVGAFVAPLVCGTLGELYGWHYGFGAAGIGMLVGIVIYIAGHRHLPADVLVKPGQPINRLQKGDGVAIVAIIVLLFIGALVWTVQTQVWTTYPLWIRDSVDRDLLGFTVPITWFQSLDMLAVLLLAPGVLWLWRRQRNQPNEPTDLTKLAIGCIVYVGAYGWLTAAEILSGEGQISLFWPVVFHFICAVGFLYIGPVMMALISRTAPAAVNAMMIGSYYLSIFVGGIVSGWLGRFYTEIPTAGFWSMHAIIVLGGLVLLIALRAPLSRALRINTVAATPEATPARAL